MICKSCSCKHDGSFGSGLYCSRSCANRRHPTNATKEKIGKKLKIRPDNFCIDCGKKLYNKRNHRCRSCLGISRRGKGIYKTSIVKDGKVKYIHERRKNLRRQFIQELGDCCSKCGYNKYDGALQFHHKDPSKKEFGLSNKHLNLSLEKLRKEVKKCILLCANCHHELHNWMHQGKTLEDFLSEHK